MAGGNPFETYSIAGLKVPRYKVAIYGIVGYAALITGLIKYKGMQPPAPVTYESKEEEAYVKRYLKYAATEHKKPLLLRKTFLEPSAI
ncbi:hypothetical protein DFS34DRAFT_639360 [Phlyctochytrium arcticum]|nr:hypothetical protein DFS34DRAFT_639360 [Phlyctochytrium arcticum]